MKRIIFLACCFYLLLSCTQNQDSKISQNDDVEYVDSLYNEADSIPKYIYNVVVNGDTDDYFNLRLFYQDRNSYELLPYTIIMADKYNYVPAYEDAFTYLWYNSGTELYSLKGLDPKSKAMILKYLKLSYKAGNVNAINIVDSLHIKF
jgi:hypothetical protein